MSWLCYVKAARSGSSQFVSCKDHDTQFGSILTMERNLNSKPILLIYALVLFFGCFGHANAAIIGPMSFDGGLEIPENNTFLQINADAEILSATLTLTHHGNIAPSSENWRIFVSTGETAYEVGTLGQSKKAVTETFDLTELWLQNAFSGIVSFYLSEDTSGMDKLELLGGSLDITAVPIPPSVLLFGTGLLGLVAFRRKLPKA